MSFARSIKYQLPTVYAGSTSALATEDATAYIVR